MHEGMNQSEVGPDRHSRSHGDFMPCRKRANVAVLCLAALILLCSAPLLWRAPATDDAKPQRGAAQEDAINWELLERVLTAQSPKDPRFTSQLGQDQWVSNSIGAHSWAHACVASPHA